MSPIVGSSQNRLERSFSSEEDTHGAPTASPKNGTPINKQRWRWRGLKWRAKLGVLPPITSTIEELRRATADGRRRYAEHRRRVLVDPHLMDEGQAPPHDLSMDNPLSLNPDSVWGRFFRNVDLERTIDKDLARLYPEHGSYFQGQSCQSMLRRVLLVWSLIHPQCSYRQGMHELLAPFMYVLHVDLERMSHIKGRYEDHFDDGFARTSLQSFSTDLVEKTKACRNIRGAGSSSLNTESKLSRTFAEHILQQDTDDFLNDVDEFDTDVAIVLMGSDMYGAEGELGSLLSARFIEHDAYCMFDALMNGQGGAVSMIDYFLSSSGAGSPLAVPPIIEASAALYRTLAAADISLYAHFVELGVEPQFFALRWLRLLFGREFLLEDLLLVWDAIFATSNEPFLTEPGNAGDEHFYGLRHSPRSAFIYALAVSMLLYLRPSLLAAPDATGCLQRLLNFPETSDVRSLIENAKLLQPLAEAAAKTPALPIPRSARLSELNKATKHTRSGSISPPTNHGQVGVYKGSLLKHRKSTPCSPEILRSALPESYWEERWKSSMLQQALAEESLGKQSEPIGTKVGSQGQLIGHLDSTITKEENKALPAGSSSCNKAQSNQQEGDTVNAIRQNEGRSDDADIILASNVSLNDESDVNKPSSSINMPGKEAHLEIVDKVDKGEVSSLNAGFQLKSADESSDHVGKSIANGIVDEALFMNIDRRICLLQEHDKRSFDSTCKVSGGSFQSNAETVLFGVKSFTNDDHLLTTTTAEGYPSNTCSPAYSNLNSNNSFTFQSAISGAESNQVTPKNFMTLNHSEDPYNEQLGSPYQEESLGCVNHRNDPEKVTCSNPSQGLTSELAGSSSAITSLKSRETPKTAAWTCGLDKLSLDERSFISQREIVSLDPSIQRLKYMWNPSSLESETDPFANAGLASRVLGRQASDYMNLQAGVEAQQDQLTCFNEHSRKAKDSGLGVQLQALGLSMMEHIQVLESALNSRHLETHTTGQTSDERSESLAKANNGSKGNVATIVALAELHKISNFLQNL